MDLRHLRYYIAIVEEGSFSVAARKRLGTSQPSLSRQIGELEVELGVTLLDRGQHGVKPTAAGLIFLGHARGILELVQQAIDATRNTGHVVRVGCLPGLEQPVLSGLREVGACRAPAPGFQVVGDISPMLYEQIRNGLLDMAFVWPGEEAPDLSSVVVCRQEIVVVFSAGHPLAGAGSLRPEALGNQVCIALAPKVAPAFWSTIDAWFQRNGLNIAPVHFAGNLTSAVSLIRSTQGFMLMPEFARTLVPAELVVLNLDKPPSITVNMVYRPASRSSVGWIADIIARQRNRH